MFLINEIKKFFDRNLANDMEKLTSIYQKLSEEFIEKYQDKVNWDKISRY